MLGDAGRTLLSENSSTVNDGLLNVRRPREEWIGGNASSHGKPDGGQRLRTFQVSAIGWRRHPRLEQDAPGLVLFWLRC